LPVSCVVAVDVSGSMAKDQRIEHAKVVATDFVRRLDAKDRIALIAFGTQVTLIHDFTNDRSALESAIASFRPEETGYTHLFDALSQSQKLALSQPSERQLIVILTDGKDEGSFLREDDIIAESQKSNLPVYAMGFGVQADIAERVLGRIATLTGGSYQYAMTYQELSGIFARLGDDLRNEFVVEYETSLPSDGQVHEVSLKVTVGSESLTSVRKLETPIRAGFWTTRRVILAVAGGVLLIVVVGLFIRRRRSGEKVQEEEIVEKGSVAVRESDTVDASAPQRAKPVPVGRSTVAMEDDKTRVIGSSAPVKAWFVLREGKSRGEELMVDKIPATIGRGSKADVRLQDQTVSAQHAKLFLEGSAVILNDLASTNGTFVNGAKVVRIEVKDNDRVRFGEIETVFKCVRLTDAQAQK